MKVNPMVIVTVLMALIKEMGVAERIDEIVDNEKLLAKDQNRCFDLEGTIKTVENETGVTLTEKSVEELMEDKSKFKLNFVIDLIAAEAKKKNAGLPVETIKGLITLLVPVLFKKK